MSELIRAGIFGPSMSGKTALAKYLAAQLWKKSRRLAVVLDPNKENWGSHAFVTDDMERFARIVWRSQGLTVIMDEGTETINRDRELTRYFTRIRHQQHHFFVIGHDGTTLLPIMRAQLTECYLFRQNPAAAQLWANQFCAPEMLDAPTLAQFEFFHARSFQPTTRNKLTAAQAASVA